jgi:hypothetical protein
MGRGEGKIFPENFLEKKLDNHLSLVFFNKLLYEMT